MDRRGSEIIDFINKYNLIIVNDPNSRLTFNSVNGTSWIDVALCSNILLNDIRKFQVSDEDCMTDHCLLSFEINVTKIKIRDRTIV